MARPKKEFRAIMTSSNTWEIVNKNKEILDVIDMQNWTKREFKAFGYRYQSDFIVAIYHKKQFGNPADIENAGGLANYLKEQGKEYPAIDNNTEWEEWNKQRQESLNNREKIVFKKEVPDIKHNLIFEFWHCNINNVNEFFDESINSEESYLPFLFKLSNEEWRNDVFEGYTAKITEDNQKFLLIDEKTKQGYVFDFIDLLKSKNLSLYDFLMQQPNVTLMTDLGYNLTLENFNNLIRFIKSDELKQYKSLYKILKNYTWFVEELAEVGKEIIVNSDKLRFKSNSKYAFYKSTRYFSEHLKNKCNRNINHSKVAKLFNLVTILGFFNKTSAQEDFKFNENPEHNYNITYFSINYLDLEKAESIATTLLDNSFSLKNLTRKFIADVFGNEFANKIYLPPKTTEINDSEVYYDSLEEEDREYNYDVVYYKAEYEAKTNAFFDNLFKNVPTLDKKSA